ncbi:type 1 fimbrial protein [Serratia marcescens]|uniref:Type 1 fimbrial protein n=1 Tax=Serratia marcescens TaxID=615 RepID=A0A5C7BJU3_SERMA|nr:MULTISPECIES: fimbrial protein [Serratia]TXE24469.1 type 1 fimbrial protein [Serratia marcescens]TXE53305.1 type 1 fimbrial protein [Serratia marcescens]
MNTHNTPYHPARRRTARHGQRLAVLLATLATGAAQAAPVNATALEDADNALTLSVSVIQGTCSLTLPKTLTFEPAIPALFAQQGRTAAVQPLTLTLKDCAAGHTAPVGLVLSGTTLKDDPRIFNNRGSDGGEVGFMFKDRAYTGGPADFLNADGTVTADTVSGKGYFAGGHIPEDGTEVTYAVGFVATGRPPVGTVSADVTIEVAYQ